MDLQGQITEWMDAASAYFADLNDLEKYGWIGMILGFLLVVAGIILLFL